MRRLMTALSAFLSRYVRFVRRVVKACHVPRYISVSLYACVCVTERFLDRFASSNDSFLHSPSAFLFLNENLCFYVVKELKVLLHSSLASSV
jgi:hypothetical protein